MTQEEFETLGCGVRVRNIDTGEIGEIVIASRNEYYVKWPSWGGSLCCYEWPSQNGKEDYDNKFPWETLDFA